MQNDTLLHCHTLCTQKSYHSSSSIFLTSSRIAQAISATPDSHSRSDILHSGQSERISDSADLRFTPSDIRTAIVSYSRTTLTGLHLRSATLRAFSFAMSAMCIPGPSRSILRHLTHLPLTPRSHLAPAIPSYRYFSSSTSIPYSDSRRQAYTLAQPLDSSSNGGFEGIPAAAYAGTVDTASSKGKRKEVDRHAAPEPPSPPTLGTSPVGERKRVIKAKKSAITMVRILFTSFTSTTFVYFGIH